MLETATFKWKNVEIDVFDGLLVDYARAKNASVIVRGIRAVSDYEYELQMAMMNRKIEPDIETVFMLPAEQYSYLSSRLVKELARLGGPIKDFVPADRGGAPPRKVQIGFRSRCVAHAVASRGNSQFLRIEGM